MAYKYQIKNSEHHEENPNEGLATLTELEKLLPKDLYNQVAMYGSNEHFRIDLDYDGKTYKVEK